MKQLNRISKIISMIITVCMLISICSVSVVFADDDRIYADPKYDYYKPIDAAGTDNHSGLYMEDQYVNLTYSNSSFVYSGNSSANGKYASIAWPPALKKRTEGDGFPAQNAEIIKEGSDYIVKSTKAKYKMPARITPTEQAGSGSSFRLEEVMMIDRYRSINSGDGIGKFQSGVVDINKSYKKIHILVGHAQQQQQVGDNGAGQFQAHVVYQDGTKTLPPEVEVSGANYKFVNNAAALIGAPESNGDNGYICEKLPLVTAQGQSQADNFVGDFVTYVSNSGATTYNGQFSKANSDTTFAAFEYTLTLDQNKTVKQIIFSQTNGSGGYMVLGISGENDPEDWTDKVEEINAAIDELVEKGADASAAEISETMEWINSAKEAGEDVKKAVKIDDFNDLFSDDEFIENLVNPKLQGIDRNEETGEFEVTWDNTTDKFKDLDDIALIIEETRENLEICSAGQDILNVYEGMVESLINENYKEDNDELSNKKDNDELIKRFELLKSANTQAFQEIFNEKLIYNTAAPSISTSAEYVKINVNFSTPLADDTKFTTDKFEVLCGSEKVDDSWITIVPNEDKTSVEVCILNSQDYSKLYTLSVSKGVKGENDKVWAYQLIAQNNASSPFTVSTSDVRLDDPAPEADPETDPEADPDPETDLNPNKIFKGKITLGNSSDSETPCVILIASYDADGKYLGTIYAKPENGIAKTGQNVIEFTGKLPNEAKEVLCYVYESVKSMTLLTPPVAIEIPS